MEMELRMNNTEMTSNSDGTLTVSGYVNKTDQPSKILGVSKRFIEKISKGAFTRSMERNKDIDFLAEHDSSKILASTRNDSLTLREDDEGLFMEATITPTSWGRDTYTLIESGLLRSMSFGFKVIKDSWRPIEKGMYERTINDLALYEVSVVKNPAYSQSTIASRGIDLIEDVQIPEELRKEEESMDELRNQITNLTQVVTDLATQFSTYITTRSTEEAEIEKPEDEEKDPVTEETERSTEEDEKSTEEETKEETETKSEEDPEEEDETEEEETEEESETEEEKEEERSMDFDLSEFMEEIKSLKMED